MTIGPQPLTVIGVWSRLPTQWALIPGRSEFLAARRQQPREQGHIPLVFAQSCCISLDGGYLSPLRVR